jgi:uncharacterized protein YqgC (DUF456 family)
MSVTPHKDPLPADSDDAPNLRARSNNIYGRAFAGFFIPLLPPIISIWLGVKIFRQIRENPDKYTGATFGWFAVSFAALQLAAWGYFFGVVLGCFPPPPDFPKTPM